MGAWRQSGFTFDTGPSLLLMTDTYRELFASAGRDLDDYVRLIPLDGQYRVIFGDGDVLTMRRTLPELIQELERIEPGVTPRFYRFLEDACNKYRTGRSEFVERDFEGARDFFGLRNLRLLLRTRALDNYYRNVSRSSARRNCGRRSACRRCTSASPPSRRRRSTPSSPTPSWPRTASGSPKAGCTP